MPTLQEQLQDVQKQIDESKLESHLISKVDKCEKNLEFILLTVLYLIGVVITYLIFSGNIKDRPFSFWQWLAIFFMPIYPGFFGIAIAYAIFEDLVKKLKYKISGFTKNDYNAAKAKISDLRSHYNTIQSSLRKEEERIVNEKKYELARIERQKKLDEEKAEREKKLEEQRIQRDIDRPKEEKLITDLNEAVYKIQNRSLSFDEGLQLNVKLKNEFNSLRFLFYHSKVYYDNRFEKISSALIRYDIIETPSPKPNRQEPSKNQILIKPKIENGQPEKKVEPFSKNYISVLQYEKTKNEESINKTDSELTGINEKPIIKAEHSAIKENAANTTESPIEELFVKNDEAEPTSPKEKQVRVPVKIDYKKLYEKKQDIGSLGEIFAYEWEKNRLAKSGKDIEKAVHVSLTNDSLGYDILSVTEDGSTKFIEVKTTTGPIETPFYMSDTEVNAMKTLKNYFIYRLYQFNIETGTSFVIMIDSENGNDNLNFQPTTYLVSPK